MDMNSVLQTLASNSPLLPSPTATKIALYGAWAMVLGCGTLLLAKRLPRTYQLGLAWGVMAWTIVPGVTSPAYWLGLAFQTPSLTTIGVCMACLYAGLQPSQRSSKPIFWHQKKLLTILMTVGAALGWVLLLDTLAWLPVSVYAWGFSSAALGCVTVLAVLLWAIFAGASEDLGANWFGPALMVFALTLFVLTRLPTGNVWDAVLDPWLWAALQVALLKSLFRRKTSDPLHQPLTPE
jgi:hypothetical protein